MQDADLVFLDGEMGGLDDSRHPSLEYAWALGLDGPIHTIRLPHDVRQCDPRALEMNGYDRRLLGDRHQWANVMQVYAFWSTLAGKTLVISNPSHDERFLLAYARKPENAALRRFGGSVPGAAWKHRKIDIASVAMPVLGYARPKGLNDICLDLQARGYDRVTLPTHGAAEDVQALRTAYYALEDIATLMRTAR